jgi:hypothetical protein
VLVDDLVKDACLVAGGLADARRTYITTIASATQIAMAPSRAVLQRHGCGPHTKAECELAFHRR